MSLRILGTGSALPEKRVTNEDLTRLVDTSDEWIVTRTGIRERRVQTSESLTELGAKAALAALENAGAVHYGARRRGDPGPGLPDRKAAGPALPGL